MSSVVESRELPAVPQIDLDAILQKAVHYIVKDYAMKDKLMAKI